MTDFHHIYNHHGEAYHRLVAAEDGEGNLSSTLEETVGLKGIQVVEVGAGTGRVTAILLEGGVAKVWASEPADDMRKVGRENLKQCDETRWTLEPGTVDDFPVPPGPVDLAVAGWVMGHFCGWYPETWRDKVNRGLKSMTSCVKPGGKVVIIETMGTGSEKAHPPNESLAEYYRFLEDEYGFSRQVISTDYHFDSPLEAAETLGFFFGPDLVRAIEERQWARVPEWTGVWTKTI